MTKLFKIQINKKYFTDAHLLIDSDGSYRLHDQNPLRNNLPSIKQEGNVRSHSICRNYFLISAVRRANIFHVAAMMILLQVMICFPLIVNFTYYFLISFILPFIKEYSFSPKSLKILLPLLLSASMP